VSHNIIGSFTGGTCRYRDAGFISHEETVNMFEETVETSDTYTKKILRSVEGTSIFATLEGAGPCRGMHVATCSPESSVNAGDEILYGVFGSSLYRIYKDGSYFLVGDVSNNGEIVSFAETSGVPGYLCICSNHQVYAVNLTSPDGEASISALTLPVRAGDTVNISPTMMTALNYRIIVNDYGKDYFYYSELGKPNGTDDQHAFYQYKTRYAYTKKDGTEVAFSDNQYYAPSEDSYVDGTLQKEDVWMGSLNFIKAEFRNDPIVAIKAVDAFMLVLGSSTYQIYQWQDSLYTPYITTGKTSSIGCKAPKSVAEVNGRVVFLGSSSTGYNSIWSVGEDGVTRISKDWLERRISTMSRSDDAFGYSYTKDGHQFYLISFPTEDVTFCYDFAEDSWTTRATRDETKNTLRMWFPSFAMRCYGKIMLGSYRENSVVYLDEDKFTDHAGRLIQRTRVTGIIINDFKDMILHSLELIIDNGRTASADPSSDGYNPRVMLQVSFDGGYTWEPECWADAGRQGQYGYSTRWSHLGKGRRVAFRVSFTDPAPFTVASAMLDYTKCGR
jgi:hypothetical protein